MRFDLMMTPVPTPAAGSGEHPPHLLSMLELAVRMRLGELASGGRGSWVLKPGGDLDWDKITSRAKDLAQTIAEKGDVLQYKGTTKKAREGTAEAFNALGEAITYLSLIPGGVPFLGYRWETRQQVRRRAMQ